MQNIGGLAPFTQGLYAATEMVIDGFMHLRRAGILKRLVFDDLPLQQLLDKKLICNPLAPGDAKKLLDYGLLTKQLSDADIVWLKRFWLLEKDAKLLGTEYGIADLRGQSDQEVIQRLLAISDARFQFKLLASAQAAGKIAPYFSIPTLWRNNLTKKLAGLKQNPCFDDYPFG